MLPLALRRRKDLGLHGASTMDEFALFPRRDFMQGAPRGILLVLLWITIVGDALRILCQLVLDSSSGWIAAFGQISLLAAFVVLPVLAIRAWRLVMHFCVQRFAWQDRTWDNLLLLLVVCLLGELAFFELATARTEWPGYSPLFPSFLGGPILAMLIGLVVVGSKGHRSVSGGIALGTAVVWVMVPLYLDLEYHIGSTHFMEYVPILWVAMVSIFGWILAIWSMLDGLGGVILAPLILAIPVVEVWKGRTSFATAGTMVVSGFALAPFLSEWLNHILD